MPRKSKAQAAFDAALKMKEQARLLNLVADATTELKKAEDRVIKAAKELKPLTLPALPVLQKQDDDVIDIEPCD